MASYLTYCMACVCNLSPLPHEIWSEEIMVYQYCPLLQKDKVLENFRKVHDVFIEEVHLVLKKTPMPRLSPEAQRLVQQYGSYFIQFPRFTYLRIGGFEEEPLKLPRYALDCFVLAEICRQSFIVIKDKLPQENWETTFPIKLGSLVCNSMINASIIGSNLLGFNFGSYHSQRNFDSKGYAMQVLGLTAHLSNIPH